MFIIGEATIEEPVAYERFSCDLEKCKGACCTLSGGRGAPLEDHEVLELKKAFPFAKKYLSEQHLRAIEVNGMSEGYPGNYATSCIDDKDCVFVYYEHGIARCSVEKAYLNGETAWRKPLSCHLFPVRISNGTVRYEKISECVPAVRRGKEENVPMYDFLKEPLVRRFGQQWYDTFRAECMRRELLLTTTT